MSGALEALKIKAPAVMGILNLTPDSFSDGGLHFEPARAMEHALRMQEEGMDLLDVGAESTRPGSEEVSPREQMSRLAFFFEAIFPQLKVPVSIDTRSAEVAEFAARAGARIINDVSGLRREPEGLLALLRNRPELVYVLMHSRGSPREMSGLCRYEDVVAEVKQEMAERLEYLERNGVSKERVILDPGIGFAKQGAQNLELLARLDDFAGMACPLLVGVSRKSFLRPYGGEAPAERAVAGELAHFMALQRGAKILRVHEVKAARQTIRFFEDCGDAARLE